MSPHRLGQTLGVTTRAGKGPARPLCVVRLDVDPAAGSTGVERGVTAQAQLRRGEDRDRLDRAQGHRAQGVCVVRVDVAQIDVRANQLQSLARTGDVHHCPGCAQAPVGFDLHRSGAGDLAAQHERLPGMEVGENFGRLIEHVDKAVKEDLARQQAHRVLRPQHALIGHRDGAADIEAQLPRAIGCGVEQPVDQQIVAEVGKGQRHPGFARQHLIIAEEEIDQRRHHELHAAGRLDGGG